MATVTPIDDLRWSPTAALFEGGEQIAASIFITSYQRGQVPPETPHGFEAVGDDPLRVVSVHPSPKLVQTDLE